MKNAFYALLAFASINVLHASNAPQLGNEAGLFLKQHEKELQTVYEANYLNSFLNDDILEFFATMLLSQTESALSLDEIMQQFKEQSLTPKIAQNYLSIFASYLSEEDLKIACELIQNKAYMKVFRQLEDINNLCLRETMQELSDLIEAHPVGAMPQSTPSYFQVTKNNITELLNSPQPVIIKVYTNYCPPCKSLSIVMDDLYKEYGHLYRFAILNAEEEEELLDLYKITAFPTVLFIKDGQEMGRLVGFAGKEKLVNAFKLYFRD